MAKYKQITVNNIIAIYPHLTKPDGAFGNEANPKYHTKFKLEGERADKLCEVIDAEMEAFATASGNKVTKRSNVPYERQEDGSVVFKATVNKYGAFGKANQWENAVVIVDAKLNPCTQVVYGGSELNLRLELYTYALNGSVGLQLRPKAVQVIKLGEPSGDMSPEEAAKAAGFSETDGFEDDSDAQAFQQGQDFEDDGDF